MNNPVIYPAQWLMPAKGTNLTAWACVACDQYTSQPAYWQEADLLVGSQPSTLRFILPECYLSESVQRIPQIQQAMQSAIQNGDLQPTPWQGFILTERITQTGARLGLVGVIDLECYDYHKGSKSLVRATEETIESRIPPRMQVRKDAMLETSHVLMLLDDPMHSVVEPLHEKRDELEKLYDFPLMMGGGHLTGYAVKDPADIQAVYTALDQLHARLDPANPLLFAVGDGNHSLATAKAIWESIKPTLTYEQTANHPARFAMVELENIHDDALVFEPIHRVLFGYDGDDLLDEIARFAAQKGASIAADEQAQQITVVFEGKEVELSISGSPYTMAVGTLQAFLDQWMQAHPETRLDYIHGEDAVQELVKGEGAIGFLLPAPDKSDLFTTVIREGAMPRKSFSMGEAHEKRYYMECRRLK